MTRRGLGWTIALGLFALTLTSGAAQARSDMAKMTLEYRQALMKVRTEPVRAIPIHLEFAVKATRAARANHDTTYMGFTRGPEGVQYLTEARTALDQLIAARGEEDRDVERLSARYEETWDRVAAICNAFREASLESARAPDDLYAGPDRKGFEALLLEEWQSLHPDDLIIDVRFHAAEWSRDRGRKWSDTDKVWSNFDRSVLAVSMIVRTTDSIATIHPASVIRDNLADGAISIEIESTEADHAHREVLIRNLSLSD